MCKKFKKSFIYVLTCALIMATFIMPQSAMAADVSLAKETFDSEVLSNCWEYGANSGVENGVFKSGGTNWNTFSFTPSTDVVVYRFKFMQPEIITTDLCRVLNSSGGTMAFRIYTSGGKIYLERSGGTLTLTASYAANTWYDVCAITPGDGSAGTAYVNGVAEGNFYNAASPGNYAKMQTFNRDSGITYFDNIKIDSYQTRAEADIAVSAENHTITDDWRYGTKGTENMLNLIEEYKAVLSDDEATEEEKTAAANVVIEGRYTDDNSNTTDYIYQNGSNYVRSYRYATAPIETVAVIETNFKLRAGGYGIRLQQVWNSESTGRPYVLSVDTEGSGNIYIDNGTGHTISTDVTGGEFHNIISVVDIPNKKINVYYDGKLIFEGEGFKNDISNIKTVEMQTSTPYTECRIAGPVLVREFDDFDAVCAYIEAENEIDRTDASLKPGYAELKAAYDTVDTAYIWGGDYATAANTLKTALTDFKDNNFTISSKFTDADGNNITKIGTNESVVAKIEATHCDNTKKPAKLFVVKYVGEKMDSIKIFETVNSFKGESTTLTATVPVESVTGEKYKIFVWNNSIAPVVESAVID